ncbi:protein TE4 [Testudinid alphaherpesvirus 3]|uniref:Protein TE4 n=1 Tax=Testudinid alphaherpesvirus 3 TaxID=2560801 RepID=A0A0K1R1G9_9ALPH|nr:protein TE4 [Testudinid alphaherpesvirus 3]AIU39314.1 protein TE4 [Testudinid alphaherpesvirus 3]AKV40743.1 hypothetical protein [Testudinid alphaherpesvirus 3]
MNVLLCSLVAAVALAVPAAATRHISGECTYSMKYLNDQYDLFGLDAWWYPYRNRLRDQWVGNIPLNGVFSASHEMPDFPSEFDEYPIYKHKGFVMESCAELNNHLRWIQHLDNDDPPPTPCHCLADLDVPPSFFAQPYVYMNKIGRLIVETNIQHSECYCDPRDSVRDHSYFLSDSKDREKMGMERHLVKCIMTRAPSHRVRMPCESVCVRWAKGKRISSDCSDEIGQTHELIVVSENYDRAMDFLCRDASAKCLYVYGESAPLDKLQTQQCYGLDELCRQFIPDPEIIKFRIHWANYMTINPDFRVLSSWGLKNADKVSLNCRYRYTERRGRNDRWYNFNRFFDGRDQNNGWQSSVFQDLTATNVSELTDTWKANIRYQPKTWNPSGFYWCSTREENIEKLHLRPTVVRAWFPYNLTRKPIVENRGDVNHLSVGIHGFPALETQFVGFENQACVYSPPPNDWSLEYYYNCSTSVNVSIPSVTLIGCNDFETRKWEFKLSDADASESASDGRSAETTTLA